MKNPLDAHAIRKMRVSDVKPLIIAHERAFDMDELDKIEACPGKSAFTVSVINLARLKLEQEGDSACLWLNSYDGPEVSYLYGENGGCVTLIDVAGLDMIYSSPDEATTQRGNELADLHHDIFLKNDAYRAQLENDKKRRFYNLRLERIEPLPEDFDEALAHLASYSSCYKDFVKLLSPNMMDLNDRNRTRIGRATTALFPDQCINLAGAGDLTLYRAMPKGMEIEAGDWVTTGKEYAEEHLGRWVEGGVIVELYVPGDEVWSHAEDPNEMIYIPKDTWSVDSVRALWESLGGANKPDDYPALPSEEKAHVVDSPIVDSPDSAQEHSRHRRI